jgi:predicted TPR repeat methyltransferase
MNNLLTLKSLDPFYNHFNESIWALVKNNGLICTSINQINIRFKVYKPISSLLKISTKTKAKIMR